MNVFQSSALETFLTCNCISGGKRIDISALQLLFNLFVRKI